MNDKELYTKKGVFSLEYDKETLRDMVLELQSNWNSLREYIEKEFYVVAKSPDGSFYDGYDTCLEEMKQDILDKMNELESGDSNDNLEKQKDNKKVHFTIDWDEDIIGYEDTMHNGI